MSIDSDCDNCLEHQEQLYKNCKVCNADVKERYEPIAIKRSLKTAHILAIKETEKPDPRFGILDVYTTMFRTIYQHEYQRNMHVERERAIHFSRISAKKEGLPICYYHDEFDDAFCNKVHKKVETEYASCKWPNPLPK